MYLPHNIKGLCNSGKEKNLAPSSPICVSWDDIREDNMLILGTTFWPCKVLE